MGIIQKNKRIFYRPGMISLVFIPLLCLCYFYKNDSFKEFGKLDIGVLDDKFFNPKVLTLRKYKEFSFNDIKSVERHKLKNLQYFIGELVKKTDTINGVKVHFGSKTDYNVFVNVIDIITVENVPQCFFYKNDILIVVPPKPKKPQKVWLCGNGEVNREYWLKKEQEAENEKEFQLKVSLFKQNWILFLGYFGIVLLNVFALIKFNKCENSLILKSKYHFPIPIFLS